MLHAEVVHASKGNCHLYGTQFLDRAVNFIISYDCGGDPEFLWHELSNDMRSNPPWKLCIVGIDDDTGEVCGHLLAELQAQYGIRQVMITQLEITHPSADMRRQMLEADWHLVEDWARANQAKFIKCWAMNEKVAKAFEKYGFKPKGVTVMELPLRLPDKEE